jgi:uncharacterized protein (DUF885 family)
MTPGRTFIAMLSMLLLTPATLYAASADQQFEALAARYVDQFPAMNPVAATELGDHRFDGKLNEVSAKARKQQVDFYRRYQKELAKIDRASLSRANQVDAALLAHSLDAGIFRIEELQEWAWNPLNYTQLSGNAVYSLMAREFAPLPDRLNSVTSRLQQLPRLLEQVRGTLQPARVPEIHAQTAVRQNRGVLSTIKEMVEPNLGSLPDQDRKALEAAIAQARAAIDQHQKWLETELQPKAKGEFRIGQKMFDRKLAATFHTPLTRQDIRARAESEFTRVRQEMYATAAEIYKKAHPMTEFPAEPDEAFKQAIIRAGIEQACKRLPGRNDIVSTAKAQLEQATKFVREKNIVTVPDDPIDIIVMPEFQRGVAIAYCDSPGALDVGQKTFYAVAPLPDDWTEQQVESFLREYNWFSLQDLTIHEAMPGHFLQLAHSNRYPSTLRAVLSSGPFIEGWAVYAEKVMVEQGYLDNDPLLKLVNLKWLLRVITNAMIDQAIHVDGMTRDQAMKLMVEGGFQEEREAALKWVRAQLSSTQLSTYFIGYQEHSDLRAAVTEKQGDQFALKAFHDQLLSYGSPPVMFVRALMLDQPIPK